MSDDFETLPGLHARAWAQLRSGAAGREHVALATVSTAGLPEARTVVLRAADEGAATVEIYTDLKSDKIASLRAHLVGSVLYWDAETALQMRAACDVTILSGQAAQSRWDGVPDHSRYSYGITPAPGRVIAESTAYHKDPQMDDFAVLQCRISHLDVLHLKQPHRRAQFSRDSEWCGNWVAP